MVGAMTEMALLRPPISPILPSSQIGIRLSSQGCFSAKYLSHLSHLDAFSKTRKVVLGQKRASRGVQLRLRVCCARASVGEDDREEPQTFPPPGELQYFGKLSASCVAGALLVKYGSLCVPSVTSPNLNVALVMIATPCLVSVALLALASLSDSDGNTRKQ